MVRSMVPVLIIQSVAENSLMQFEKASDLDVAGASHTSRLLQSGRAMESQWKGLLQQIVDSGSWQNPATGSPWIPDKVDILQPVEDAITSMEGELGGQKTMNDDIMLQHSKHVEKCNTDLEGSLSGAISGNLEQAQAAEKEHKECREQEDTDIGNMESTCNTFEKIPKCDKEQDWYADYAEGGDDGAGSLKEVVLAAQNCKQAIGSTSDKAKECDKSQTAFTDKWCSYKRELDEACDNYAVCYTETTDNYDQAKESITKLEDEQKTIYKMLGRIKCYLKLLFQKANQGKAYVPTQDDITACEGQEIDATALKVDYKSKAAQKLCADDDRVKGEPVGPDFGPTTWSNTKYLGLNNHNKLNADETCER